MAKYSKNEKYSSITNLFMFGIIHVICHRQNGKWQKPKLQICHSKSMMANGGKGSKNGVVVAWRIFKRLTRI